LEHLVLFDLGGTLIWFDGSWPEVMAASEERLLSALYQAGFRLDLPRFLMDFRTSLRAYYDQRDTEFVEYTTAALLRDMLARYGHPKVDEVALASILAEMYSVSQSHWIVEEDAIPTLKALKFEGYHLGLVSNASNEADVQALLRQSGLEGFFELVLVSAVVGYRKPHPLIFQAALQHWDCAPTQAVMVGDTLGADVLGANNMGMASVWITRRVEQKPLSQLPRAISPSATIHALSELPDLLPGLFLQHGDT
jgi:HAD superfamily hydrolase (TIGR01662 family)